MNVTHPSFDIYIYMLIVMEELEQESIFVVNPFVMQTIEMMKATAAVRDIILLSTTGILVPVFSFSAFNLYHRKKCIQLL